MHIHNMRVNNTLPHTVWVICVVNTVKRWACFLRSETNLHLLDRRELMIKGCTVDTRAHKTKEAYSCFLSKCTAIRVCALHLDALFFHMRTLCTNRIFCALFLLFPPCLYPPRVHSIWQMFTTLCSERTEQKQRRTPDIVKTVWGSILVLFVVSAQANTIAVSASSRDFPS